MRLLGQTGTGGLLVDYTSGHRGAAYAPPTAYSTTTDSAIIQHYAQQCIEQLEHVFPGISAHYTGKAALRAIHGRPLSPGQLLMLAGWQYTHFAGYEGMRQGPIHFAGEHCSVEFQGFMEGEREKALGRREILQDYGLA